MKCNVCGNGVADNTTFCPYCGSAIKREVNNEQSSNINEIGVNNLEVSASDNQNINSNAEENNMSVEQNISAEPINDEVSQHQINNTVNYDANNMYNMQNYQSVDTQTGYGYNASNYNNQYNINSNVPNYNNSYNMNDNPVEDKANVGLAILSWFIPLVGIILFFTKKKTSPKTSKVCGLVALIAIVLSIIATFIAVMVINEALEDIVDVNDYEVSEEYDNNYSSGNNIWETYKVSINNKEIKIPCSYEEFVNKSNFKIKVEKENLTLSNYYYDIINIYNDDKLAGIINLYNKSGSDVMYKNANVSRISQSKYNIETNKVDKFIFPGQLYAGKKITKDEVIKLLGKPAKENETEYNGIKTYTLKYTTKESYTTSSYYEIIIIEDVINEIILDNRP